MPNQETPGGDPPFIKTPLWFLPNASGDPRGVRWDGRAPASSQSANRPCIKYILKNALFQCYRICIYIYIYIHIYIYICTHIVIYVFIFIFIFIIICICIHTIILVYIYTYIERERYVYTYIWFNNMWHYVIIKPTGRPCILPAPTARGRQPQAAAACSGGSEGGLSKGGFRDSCIFHVRSQKLGSVKGGFLGKGGFAIRVPSLCGRKALGFAKDRPRLATVRKMLDTWPSKATQGNERGTIGSKNPPAY